MTEDTQKNIIAVNKHKLLWYGLICMDIFFIQDSEKFKALRKHLSLGTESLLE